MNGIEHVSTPTTSHHRGDIYLTRDQTTAILTEYNARWFLVNLIDGSIAKTELTKADCLVGARKLESDSVIKLIINQVED